MLIPLYGFLEGDTLGLLILVEEHETVRDLATKLQQAARVRVACQAQVEVRYQDRVLDPHDTIAQAEFVPLERFDVVQKDETHGIPEGGKARRPVEWGDAGAGGGRQEGLAG